EMSAVLYRLAHWCVRRRLIVLAARIAALLGTVALSIAASGSTSDGFEMPGTESQRAIDLLEERFPSESGSVARVVFATEDGSSLAEPRLAGVDEATLDEIAAIDGVADVADTFVAGSVAPDGTVAF